MSSEAQVPKVYDKIRDSRREELIRMVEIYKIQMKLAAQQLEIKYSTARHILKQYRINNSDRIRPKPLDLSVYTNPIMRNLTSYTELANQISNQCAIGTDDPRSPRSMRIKEELPGIREMLVELTRSELSEPRLLKQQKLDQKAIKVESTDDF